MAQWPERALQVRRLGTVPYEDGVLRQAEFVKQRRDGAVPDQLLLLEHPHVITSGSGGDPAHILKTEQELERLGVQLLQSGRGGDVTYHGPGQLVGYPVLDLKPDRMDLHEYLRSLERVLIRALSDFGVHAREEPSLTGVWVSESKIGAIGIRVSSGWITSHGFALNVNTDLTYFDAIVPCGIGDREVTSLERLLGRPVPIEEVGDAVIRGMKSEFGYGTLDDSGRSISL